jgi:hypothetical protein
MSRASLLEIPFGKGTGEPVYYVEPWMERDGKVVWKPNTPFTDTLRFTGFGRGRSAAHALFKSTVKGTSYTVFLTDFSDILREKDIIKGEVSARWHFVKRGSNYGLRMMKEES